MSKTTIAPVRVSVTVRAPQRRAFEVFSARIADWWPSATHSIEGEDVTTVVMDGREGGRIVERHNDGSEANWGVIRVWEPPARLVFSWNPSYEQRPETEVEVRFLAISESHTRVELEHRGWEALGERALDLHEGYSQGWRDVLDRYARRASDE
jgi:uncharacterized protein YndB with AHSA1/START domain